MHYITSSVWNVSAGPTSMCDSLSSLGNISKVGLWITGLEVFCPCFLRNLLSSLTVENQYIELYIPIQFRRTVSAIFVC